MGHNVLILTGKKNGRFPKREYVEDRNIAFYTTAQSNFELYAFPNLNSTVWTSRYPELIETVKKPRKDLELGKLDINSISELLYHQAQTFSINLKHSLENILNAKRDEFDGGAVDVIIPHNTLSLPMQIPAAVALGNLIRLNNIPTLGRHHDFYFERERFLDSLIGKTLQHYFPVDHKSVRHYVINELQKEQLANPKLIDFDIKPMAPLDSIVIPNSFDFNFDPNKMYSDKPTIPNQPRRDKYNNDFRYEMGLTDDDIILLQHTRIVERKNIEASVDILREMRKYDSENASRYKLLMPLSSKEEGNDYYNRLRNYIESQGFKIGYVNGASSSTGDVIFVLDRVNSHRCKTKGNKIYHYLDPYHCADAVLYPSTNEGWGNVVGEAVQAKKPLVVNRYDVYDESIRPLGFSFIEMQDGKVSDPVIRELYAQIHRPEIRSEVVEHNFKIGKSNIGLDNIEEAYSTNLDDPSFLQYVWDRRESLANK